MSTVEIILHCFCVAFAIIFGAATIKGFLEALGKDIEFIECLRLAGNIVILVILIYHTLRR